MYTTQTPAPKGDPPVGLCRLFRRLGTSQTGFFFAEGFDIGAEAHRTAIFSVDEAPASALCVLVSAVSRALVS
jgi:hypothetical protein